MLPSLRASSSKTRINSSPMIRRFVSGSSTPFSPLRKRCSAAIATTFSWEVFTKGMEDVTELIFSEEAIVYEDTGQVIAENTMHQKGGHCGIDTA